MILNIIVFIMILASVRYMSIKLINSDSIPEDKVFDFCHYLLPDWRNYQKVKNVYDAYTAIPIVTLLFKIIQTKNWYVLKEYLILAFIVNMTRIFFYSITVLPDANGECDKEGPTGYVAVDSLFFGTCRDLMYSGHISNSYLAWLYLFNYYDVRKSIGLAHQMGLVATMLCLRRHYSIDVITAYAVTYLIFDKRNTIMDFLGVEK